MDKKSENSKNDKSQNETDMINNNNNNYSILNKESINLKDKESFFEQKKSEDIKEISIDNNDRIINDSNNDNINNPKKTCNHITIKKFSLNENSNIRFNEDKKSEKHNEDNEGYDGNSISSIDFNINKSINIGKNDINKKNNNIHNSINNSIEGKPKSYIGMNILNEENKNDEIIDQKILEIQKYEKILSNYTDIYFDDDNNFFLPPSDIMDKYDVVPIEDNENEIIIEQNNNNLDNENKVKAMDLFYKKKYMEEKIINIEQYFIRKNKKIKIDDFLDNNPFTTFRSKKMKKKLKKSSITNFEIKEDEINDNNLYVLKESTVGNVEHFVNLLYKYKKYTNNEEEEKKEKESFLNKVDIIMELMGGKIQKSKIINYNGKIFDEKEKEVFFDRSVLNDGYSFFRAFIFGLLETYILENNIKKFNNFVTLISNSFFENIYTENKTEHSALILELKEILENLNNNKVNDALKLLYNSFSYKSPLGNFLIIFLKKILSFSKKQKLNGISLKNVEFEFIDLFYLPFIFDITLEISFDIKKGKNKFYVFNSYSEIYNKTLLQLCFYKNNTFIYYNIDKYFKLVKYNIIQKYENIPKINKVIYKLDKKLNCEKCKSQTTHIALIEKNILVCENCLDKYKNQCLNNRINLLNTYNFVYRDIIFKSLTIKENQYYLDDYEYFHLFNDYLIDSIQKKYTDYIHENNYYYCAKCLKIDKNMKKFECGCFYCTECLDAIISRMTDGLIILNEFEKKHIGKIRCKCGNNMDILNIIEEKENNTDNHNVIYILMVKRMNEYINSMCMNCECKVLKNENEKQHLMLVIENVKTNIFENHILCDTCYNNLKIGEKNEIDLYCKICFKNHKIMSNENNI